jgi:hypothetical protein
MEPKTVDDKKRRITIQEQQEKKLVEDKKRRVTVQEKPEEMENSQRNLSKVSVADVKSTLKTEKS